MTVAVNTVAIPNGETIAYREREGGAVPLVLLHGNLTSSRHFDVVFEAMDPRYKLYAMDMRGFGASSYETPIDGVGEFATDVAAFADAVGLDSFHLGGWSFGGAVALAFAATYPGRVRKLVLIAPVGTRGSTIYPMDGDRETTDRPLTTCEELAQTRLVQILENGDRDALREEVVERFVYTHNQPDPERYAAYIEDSFAQRNLVDVNYARVHFNLSDEPTQVAQGTGEAARITAPTLVLVGDRDSDLAEADAKTTVEDIGDNAELVVLTDCGHSPFIDDLDQLLERVTDFLAS
jgi:pimeloyl-ACP methyl ester carboxylesterase